MYARHWTPRIVTLFAAGLVSLSALSQETEPDDNRTRYFYVAPYIGAADLNTFKLSAVSGRFVDTRDTTHASFGANFGFRLSDVMALELGHRRIADGNDDGFDFGIEDDLRLDSYSVGAAWEIPLGAHAELNLGAGVQHWRYRFTQRIVPFPSGTVTVDSVSGSGSGGYARLGASWKMNPSMSLGGTWTYLDIENAGANAVEFRFAYKF